MVILEFGHGREPKFGEGQCDCVLVIFGSSHYRSRTIKYSCRDPQIISIELLEAAIKFVEHQINLLLSQRIEILSYPARDIPNFFVECIITDGDSDENLLLTQSHILSDIYRQSIIHEVAPLNHLVLRIEIM